MEPRSSLQQLPQGKGNEQVMKEEIEVKLAVAEDTDDGEMEHREDTRSRIEYYGKKQVQEADEVKLDEAKDTSQSRLTEGEGKEGMEQADEVKLDVAEHKSDEATGPIVECVSGSAVIPSVKEPSEVFAMIASDEGTSSIIGGESAELDRVNINSRYLHKIHPGLRSHGEIAKHYEPILVSIGPYHHGKEALQDMEKKKNQYVQVLQKRVQEKSNDVDMKALENEARDCYVDTFTMDVNSFRECVVLDGLFMIEIFRRTKEFKDYDDKEESKDYDDKDMFFTMEWMKPLLQCDLLLFENQIPLFVLRQLFKMTKEIYPKMGFVELALGFFFNEKHISDKGIEIRQLDDIPHLLGLVYEALSVRKRRRVSQKSWDPIWSAGALEEVGVTFVGADDDAAIYDINFNSGTLRIPRLVITDNTQSFFRNLVAYEQYSNKCCLHQITNYLQVMDYLINTPKDVELLRRCGIIDNMLGDDVKVSTMFSQICSGVLFNKKEFFYAEMFDEVNKFCQRRRNAWMKKLKDEYFGSPWALISFMAAVMLLLLTATQTVFAVISYFKQ